MYLPAVETTANFGWLPNPSTESSKYPITDEFKDNMVYKLTHGKDWSEEKCLRNITVYSCTIPNQKLKVFKVATEIKCSFESVVDLLHLHLVERHKEWNSTFDNGRILQEIDKDCNVQYWAYKFSSSLIKPRDFVVNHRIWRNQDELVLMETTTTHKDAPLRSSFVRCDLPFNIRYLKSIGDGRIQFLYMNLTDIKGMIPIWLANKLNPDVSFKEVELIKNILENTNKPVRSTSKDTNSKDSISTDSKSPSQSLTNSFSKESEDK